MKNLLGNMKFFILVWCLINGCHPNQRSKNSASQQIQWQAIKLMSRQLESTYHIHINLDSIQKNIEIINPTFLGNTQRNYYGNSPPDSLHIAWRFHLGKGKTIVGRDTHTWAGAGWTGQPLMFYENDTPMIVQGAFDHSLRKINAKTNKEVWRYTFDDVLKGTGSFYYNPNFRNLEESCMIIQGARSGGRLYKEKAYSLRAISYFSGKELWRMNVGRTRSYSRDVDASGLIIDSTMYIGLENGIFTIIDLSLYSRTKVDHFYTPRIIKQSDTLYSKAHIRLHGGNLVTEASPTRIDDHIYIASGAGHISRFSMIKNQIDWHFETSSDLDGTPSVTYDNTLLVPIEKQFIKGRGGLLNLDPHIKNPIRWYFPTPNKKYESWLGGIIGSASHNANYKAFTSVNFACFTSIDGYLYVVSLDSIDGVDTLYDGITLVPKPQLLFKYKTGPSISTPIIVDDHIISSGYRGTYLFKYDSTMHVRLVKKFDFWAEATPFCFDGSLYLASRNGYLYCIE